MRRSATAAQDAILPHNGDWWRLQSDETDYAILVKDMRPEFVDNRFLTMAEAIWNSIPRWKVPCADCWNT